MSCDSRLNAGNANLIQLEKGIDFPGNLQTIADADFYRFAIAFNQTITFNLTISPNTTAPINVVFTIYYKDATTGNYINLGSLESDTTRNVFNYNATDQTYYICITTTFDIDYTLSVDFIQYNAVINLECDARHGSVAPFEFKQPLRACDSPVAFEMVGGVLPIGLSFGTDGQITGTPVELDCQTGEDIPPSYMLFDRETNDSIPVEFIIDVRVYLLQAPETEAFRSFKVCVYNNWTVDEDFVNSIRDVWEDPHVVEVGNESWQPVIDNGIIPDHLPAVNQQCPVKDSTPVKEFTELEIIKLREQVIILPDTNLKGIDGSLCDDCDDVSTSNVNEFEAISDVCEPCPIVPVFTELLPIPPTECTTKTVTVSETLPIELSVPKYAELVNDIPTNRILYIQQDMETNKFCGIRPTHKFNKVPSKRVILDSGESIYPLPDLCKYDKQ